jgi:hypothetical protein
MVLNSEKLEQQCEAIRKLREVKNRIVVLCEGGTSPENGRHSPQWYARLQKMPDASFYKRCVPMWWRERLPHFLNCGARKDVIDIYFALVEWHKNQGSSADSYLDTQKLFAFVDLDIQPQSIGHDYPFGDTETILHSLYDATKVNEQNVHQHRIWVTGLIHKEAYFLLPQMQEIFAESTELFYNQSPLSLDTLYLDMAKAIESDEDIKKHFSIVADRIKYCNGLDARDPEKLSSSWQKLFQPDAKNYELILALLMIKKAKEYWKKIGLQPGDEFASSRIRDTLILAIGEFYAHQEPTPDMHIPFFLKAIYSYI